MSVNSPFAAQIPIAPVASQTYALNLIVAETVQELWLVAQLPLDAPFDRALGLTHEARIRIMLRLRQVFGAQLPADASACPNTLRELLRDAVPGGSATAA
jgi:hypothetical protein